VVGFNPGGYADPGTTAAVGTGVSIGTGAVSATVGGATVATVGAVVVVGAVDVVLVYKAVTGSFDAYDAKKLQHQKEAELDDLLQRIQQQVNDGQLPPFSTKDYTFVDQTPEPEPEPAPAPQPSTDGAMDGGGGSCVATNTGPPDLSDVNAGDLKDAKASRVTSATGLNPEVIKAEYLGRDAQVSRFDLKRDSCTGYLVIVEKATQRVVEVTHYQMGSG
jgi:hypothetical protein